MERITSPESANLGKLCESLAANAQHAGDQWPESQLAMCGDAGVYEWFLPTEFGGQAWSEADIVKGYLRLSASCLTTTFVITQRMGACKRIAASSNRTLAETLLPDLMSGKTFATVGISHLTTSRRHLAKPVLQASEVEGGFLLDGFSPWVTGATAADMLVLGASLDDGREVLLAADAKSNGVQIEPPPRLVALTGSQTGQVRLNQVFVPDERVIDGPIANVMQGSRGAMSGGLQTSTLAVGVASAALDFLRTEAEKRTDLQEPAQQFAIEYQKLEFDLLQAASGIESCSSQDLRTRANSLVLRLSQAALTAAKGAGFVEGHPAGRWCREALFFLVWSCPQPVLNANLCQLASMAT